MPKNCATLSIVTFDRQTSRNVPPLRNQRSRQWQSTRTARKTSQPPSQQVPWYQTGNLADPAGFGDRREGLFCSCSYYCRPRLSGS
mgnify:FL=1